MDIVLEEPHVRQAVAAAISTTLPVPQADWSFDFVQEAVLTELTAPHNSSPQQDAAGTSQLMLSQPALQLLQQYQEAMTAGPRQSAGAAVASAPVGADNSNKGSSKGSKGSRVHGKASSVRQSGSSSDSSDTAPVCPAGLEEQLQTLFGQLLQDNYKEVEDADVTAFGLKLLQELSRLVAASAANTEDDVEGLCQLCEREMPLTKHHLIPRDVHKDFKKKGFGFSELQAGVMVCRPCHSAIHRAVPDNKELAEHYRTLEALQQHEEITKFAAWARRQRVTNKADVQAVHFRYRR